ncbi:MAG: LPS assembly protein LptD [Candidatus Omnitrophica bacterium]|nr:LPS assembly protein LptD [Candidatus Omnitrophota bacterium]
MRIPELFVFQMVRRACLIFIFLIGIPDMLAAQPAVTSELAEPGTSLQIDAETVEHRLEENRLIGTGKVTVTYKGARLKADMIEVDVAAATAEAGGNVTMTYQDITLRGKKLLYNFDTQMGYVFTPEQESIAGPPQVRAEYQDAVIEAARIDFDLRRRQAFAPLQTVLTQGGRVATGENLRYDFVAEQAELMEFNAHIPPWYGYAQTIWSSREKAIFERGWVSTCDREQPHYRVTARQMKYYPGQRIVAKHAVMYLGKVPVLYFPYWQYSLLWKESNFSVQIGRRKNWGTFALTSWRNYINDSTKTTVHADYRQLRGAAGGLDVDFTTPAYGSGAMKTYYTNDENKNDDPPRERERYRGQYKHRWEVNAATLAMLEYNKLSDIEFSKDYLYREYEANVQPASEASVSYADPAYNALLYARVRTNNFYSEVERLPEAVLTGNAWALGDSNFYYRTRLAAGNLQKKNAGSELDTDANRIDVFQELSYPTHLPDSLAWITLTPFTGMRQTYYSKDPEGDQDVVRGIHTYGMEMNTTLFRFFDYRGDFAGIEINRMRHMLKPTVRYEYIHEPTVPAGRLPQFDEIDAIGKKNAFTLGLENILQTKWQNLDTAAEETADLIYLYPQVDYFANRDDFDRHFSSVRTEFDVRPYRWLRFDSDTVYDQYARRFTTANFDMSALGAHEKWKLSLGKRYDRDVSEQVTGDIYYALTRLWQLRYYGRYESYTDHFQEQQYTVYRDLHCWLMEMTYGIKLTEDGFTQDRTFWFVFRLKAFPEFTPLRLSVGYETTPRSF